LGVDPGAFCEDVAGDVVVVIIGVPVLVGPVVDVPDGFVGKAVELDIGAVVAGDTIDGLTAGAVDRTAALVLEAE
jgi:hypothetical protein